MPKPEKMAIHFRRGVAEIAFVYDVAVEAASYEAPGSCPRHDDN